MGGDGTSSGTGARDARFLGSVPDVYERLLVPMIFTEPAARLAAAVARAEPRSVLETAAGTGALTRALVRACPGASVLATDLNQPMLEQAAARSTPDADARVTWQRADARSCPSRTSASTWSSASSG